MNTELVEKHALDLCDVLIKFKNEKSLTNEEMKELIAWATSSRGAN